MSFWADVLVHTALFMGFLPAFFFLYVSPTQVNSLERDAMEMIKPVLSDIALGTNPNNSYELNTAIQAGVQQMENIPDLQSFSQQIASQNANILKYLSIVVGIVAPIFFLLGVYLAWSSGEDMMEFAISNLIVIGFIAMSEFAIVGLFFSQFVEIDSYFVKASLAQRMTYNSNYGDCLYVDNWVQSILPASIYNYFFTQ